MDIVSQQTVTLGHAGAQCWRESPSCLVEADPTEMAIAVRSPRAQQDYAESTESVVYDHELEGFCLRSVAMRIQEQGLR